MSPEVRAGPDLADRGLAPAEVVRAEAAPAVQEVQADRVEPAIPQAAVSR